MRALSIFGCRACTALPLSADAAAAPVLADPLFLFTTLQVGAGVTVSMGDGFVIKKRGEH